MGFINSGTFLLILMHYCNRVSESVDYRKMNVWIVEQHVYQSNCRETIDNLCSLFFCVNYGKEGPILKLIFFVWWRRVYVDDNK